MGGAAARGWEPGVIHIIGGGLAGSEAAWQASRQGVPVVLYEMRPVRPTPVHHTDRLAELVCSNSFRADQVENAVGLLKEEMRRLGSLVMRVADETRVPAGGALAVDRAQFAQGVTTALEEEPLVTIRREEVRDLPRSVDPREPVVVATGPLTSPDLSAAVATLVGQGHLYFYDAISPIVLAESIDRSVAFRASRWGRDSPAGARRGANLPVPPAGARRGRDLPPAAGVRRGRDLPAALASAGPADRDGAASAACGAGLTGGGSAASGGSAACYAGPADGGGASSGGSAGCGDGASSGGNGAGLACGDDGQGDYLNCPLTEAEYRDFHRALCEAEAAIAHPVDQGRFFEGCLPIEEMARRGADTLRFGPMKPVGLTDPRTGRRPFAVVQLRQDTLAGDHFSLVGFQTRLKWGEQKRIVHMIPGLGQAEFVRFGMIHRNTYINGPAALLPTWQARRRPSLFFAGQISGVEGYVESAASGLVAGLNAAALARGRTPAAPPRTTAIGALGYYVSHAAAADYQPSNIAFGLIPATGDLPRRRRDRRRAVAARALEQIAEWRVSGEGGGGAHEDPSAPVSGPSAVQP